MFLSSLECWKWDILYSYNTGKSALPGIYALTLGHCAYILPGKVCYNLCINAGIMMKAFAILFYAKNHTIMSPCP